MGQDSHRFSEVDKKLILGGFEVDLKNGLEGNSDGDVVIHALCNALEQAIGGDSFSVYADELCGRGVVDSREYLKVALENISKKGYQINNIGITIEAKTPKILPIADEIKGSLTKILKIKKSDIGINATTGEEMTAFGKGQGMQVFAIVSLIKKNNS